MLPTCRSSCTCNHIPQALHKPFTQISNYMKSIEETFPLKYFHWQFSRKAYAKWLVSNIFVCNLLKKYFTIKDDVQWVSDILICETGVHHQHRLLIVTIILGLDFFPHLSTELTCKKIIEIFISLQVDDNSVFSFTDCKFMSVVCSHIIDQVILENLINLKKKVLLACKEILVVHYDLFEGNCLCCCFETWHQFQRYHSLVSFNRTHRSMTNIYTNINCSFS